MEHYIGFILFGLFIGIIGTIMGAGGGFILTPVLLLLYPHESPDVITSTSLAVTFVNALSGSIAYARMKRIDYKSGLTFSIAAIPGAILGALSTYYVPRHTFDLFFAFLLISISLFLFFKTLHRHHLDAHDPQSIPSYNRTVGIGLSFIVGYFSSFLGIGGGIIHVPMMVNILYFPVHVATATSHFILAIVTFVGTMVHIVTGTFDQGLHRTVPLAMGALVGAQLGAFFSSKVKGTWIIRLLAVALLLVGLRLIFTTLRICP